MVSLTQACRFNDSGQRCNSSKRFIVLEKHYDDFVKNMKINYVNFGNMDIDFTAWIQLMKRFIRI